MKLRHLLFFLSLLLLQSCQNKTEVKEENTERKKNLVDASAYNTQLGMGYLQQGDRARAKTKLLLALSQAPNSPAANAAMGYFMEKSGDMDNAQLYYKKAMSAAPGSGAQLNNYGTFLCRRGQYRQAEEYFMKAVKDIEYNHTSGAYENAGLCVLAIPDNDAAAKYFAKALEQDPSRAQSLYELVKLEINQNHLNEALAYLQKYPEISLHDQTLLAMAVDVAHKSGKADLEADYQLRLQSFSEKTGGKDEYNSNNG